MPVFLAGAVLTVFWSDAFLKNSYYIVLGGGFISTGLGGVIILVMCFCFHSMISVWVYRAFDFLLMNLLQVAADRGGECHGSIGVSVQWGGGTC